MKAKPKSRTAHGISPVLYSPVSLFHHIATTEIMSHDSRVIHNLLANRKSQMEKSELWSVLGSLNANYITMI